ncbi:hypothetical protein TRFO_04401 [Tritrichomonas foetus]|uniref:Serine/threonine-protein phosphatase n=1 Tax=Tritrichomonas foetus TaxID=1144522 RepID=A0A1J4KFB3_9EUKA|nr:hypothetical protein TRFO_04401 [Tritrichomonas foetus]|eukprot:OHT09867.1 hypothetical protein TRFO_04401 [Tritrichomonas foetus]
MKILYENNPFKNVSITIKKCISLCHIFKKLSIINNFHTKSLFLKFTKSEVPNIMIQQQKDVDYISIYQYFATLLIRNANDYSTGGTTLQLPIIPRSVIQRLSRHVTAIFSTEETVIKIEGPIIVVGDLHGHILDLFRILKRFGSPPRARYLFLGDLVDRGEFSIETIVLVYVMKVLFPTDIYVIRGNHEFSEVCSNSGFLGDISSTYNSEDVFQSFLESFANMPLAAIINKTTICVHGGLGPSIRDIKDIEQIKKPIYDYQNEIVASLVWSDPDASDEKENLLSFTPQCMSDQNNINQFFSNINSHECQNNNISHISDFRNPSISDFQVTEKKNSPDMFSQERNYSLPQQPQPQSYQQSYHLDKLIHIHQNVNEDSDNDSDTRTNDNLYLNRHENHSKHAHSHYPFAIEIGNPENENSMCINEDKNEFIYEDKNEIIYEESNDVNLDEWYKSSPRGYGYLFNRSSFDAFMSRSGFERMLRGHQCVLSGTQSVFNGRLTTVFGASHYCGNINNNAGVINIRQTGFRTETFKPIQYLRRYTAMFIASESENAFVLPKFTPPNRNNEGNGTSPNTLNDRSRSLLKPRVTLLGELRAQSTDQLPDVQAPKPLSNKLPNLSTGLKAMPKRRFTNSKLFFI